ncbi:MAG: hypothetical protein QOH62_1985 [Solirubrobacteraceae bacterium]|nr:hypothetical protein [Solirubrobacteraceae bacterium]
MTDGGSSPDGSGAQAFCSGCGELVTHSDHALCRRRERATDPPRFCTDCGRKLVVQVLPIGWTARCVRCTAL